MKKYQIKTILLASLLTFTTMANATNGGKTKPPADTSSEDRAAATTPAPTPEPTPTPSFWDLIMKHFYM